MESPKSSKFDEGIMLNFVFEKSATTFVEGFIHTCIVQRRYQYCVVSFIYPYGLRRDVTTRAGLGLGMNNGFTAETHIKMFNIMSMA